MGGATIRAAGGHYPPPSKDGEQGSKYIVYILYACNKKYTLHVYSMRKVSKLPLIGFNDNRTELQANIHVQNKQNYEHTYT